MNVASERCTQISLNLPSTHPLLDGVPQRFDLRPRRRLPQPDVVGQVILFDARTRLALLRLVGVYASLLDLDVDVFVHFVEGALAVDVGTDSAADDDARGAAKMR